MKPSRLLSTGPAQILVLVEDQGGEALLISDFKLPAQSQAHRMTHFQLRVCGQPKDAPLILREIPHALHLGIAQGLGKASFDEDAGDYAGLSFLELLREQRGAVGHGEDRLRDASFASACGVKQRVLIVTVDDWTQRG